MDLLSGEDANVVVTEGLKTFLDLLDSVLDEQGL